MQDGLNPHSNRLPSNRNKLVSLDCNVLALKHGPEMQTSRTTDSMAY